MSLILTECPVKLSKCHRLNDYFQKKSGRSAGLLVRAILVANYFHSDISLMVRVFANGPGDLGSISGQVISKTPK